MCNNYLEGRGGRLGNGWNMPPKLSHAPPLIKQKLISTPPPHIMIILRLPPPPPITPHPLPWKKFPPIESLIPSLLVGFLPPEQKSVQMSRRVIWRVIRITGLWACVVFAWIGRFLIFYSISGTKVPACVGENSINQLSLASTYLKAFLL